MLGGAVHNKELAAVGVFAFIRHRQHPPPLFEAPRAINLIFKPAPPAALPALARAGRVPALDHEGADVAVEGHAGVVAALGEREEVPYREGREFGVQLEGERAERGAEGGVPGEFDAASVQEVGFVGEEREVRGRGCVGG